MKNTTRNKLLNKKIQFILLLLFVIVSQGFMSGINAQTSTVTIQKKNISVKEVLAFLEENSKVVFFYADKDVDLNRKLSINVKNQPLTKVLEEVFRNTSNTFKLDGKQIYITKKSKSTDTQSTPSIKRSKISGVVTDQTGEAIIGASVSVKGTKMATITDYDGKFFLDIPEESVLTVSYIGYLPTDVKVGNLSYLKIELPEDTKALSEVVVVGYGTQKKLTTIGAQSSITAKELQSQPMANISNAIAGRVAGVIGVQRSGEPGYDGSAIYIRGISSFTNSGPLVLVDGVERDFGNVDPEDIASFSVLKDASATAVYGVRGANGVILIETKKGDVGKPKIKFQVNQGITQFTMTPQFADGVTYMKMANEAYLNSNPTSTMAKYSNEAIQKTADGSDPDLYPNVNWIKELFKPSAQNRRVNMNVNGGSEKAKYYLSLGYYNETGMYKADDMAQYNSSLNYDRYNFTSNLTLQMLKHTKLDFGASGWISDGNYPGSSSGSIWNAAYVLPPISIPPRYSNGYIAGTRQGDVSNPYDLLTQTGYVSEVRSQIWSNVRLTQDLSPLLKGLSIYGLFSFDNYNAHTISRTKTVDSYLATGRDTNGNLVFDQTRIGSNYLGYNRTNGGNRQFYEEAALNYSNTFGKNEIGGLLLYNQSDRVDAFAANFIASIPTRFQGIASRATYAYDSKYLAEVNLGYNGSENFEKGKRFGLFPSFGVGWVASSEKFFEPVSSVVQFLKFRGSYGIVGGSNIGNGRRFAYISTVNTTNDNVYSFGQTTDNSYKGTDIGDYSTDVTWEKAKKLNLGAELRALKGAFSMTVDLFQEDRTGIFLQRGDLPVYAGVLNSPWGNLGEIYNKGIDATFSYNKKITKDLSVEFRGNFTWNRATVVNNASAPWPYQWQQLIGRKLGQRFGLTALGLFQSKDEIANSPKQTGDIQPGDVKYKDLNGDGKIDNYDAGPIGYGSMPEMVYGFGPSVSYKGFAVGGWFKGISNVDISVGGEGFQPFSQEGRGNLMSNITDRWTPENPGNNHVYPRLTYPSSSNSNYVGSTWWLRNGAFLRLQNVELSYTFQQKKLLKSIGLTNLRIYMIGYNLLTFSGFKEWDVELGDGKGASYPLTKSFNFGIECQL